MPGRISGEQPYPALLQDLPMLWTVGISPRGEGLTGRGNLFPLPCLSCSRYLASAGIPLPARAFGKGYPYVSAGTLHPARAFIGDTRTLLAPHPTRASAGRPAHSFGIPHPACASAGIPVLFRLPHPARACGAPPPPQRGAGAVLAISGEQPYPGWSRWESRARRSALCAGPRGEARSPFFSGLSPRGRPWRLSPRGGRPCPAPIRTDARPSPPSPACFRIFQVR